MKTVKYEKHEWGYFVYTDEKAVALLSLKEEDLRKVLKDEFCPLIPKSI